MFTGIHRVALGFFCNIYGKGLLESQGNECREPCSYHTDFLADMYCRKTVQYAGKPEET